MRGKILYFQRGWGRGGGVGKGWYHTLQATLWGQSLPKPSGGEIFRSRVTTSTCLIRPLASGSYSDHSRTNSSRWWGPGVRRTGFEILLWAHELFSNSLPQHTSLLIFIYFENLKKKILVSEDVLKKDKMLFPFTMYCTLWSSIKNAIVFHILYDSS